MSMNITIKPQKLAITTGKQIAREYVEVLPYEGEYEVTATNEIQILPTRNLRMTADLLINPIPSNYGRIDWNGQYLTVS